MVTVVGSEIVDSGHNDITGDLTGEKSDTGCLIGLTKTILRLLRQL